MNAKHVFLVSGRIMRQLIRGKRFHFYFWLLPIILLALLKFSVMGNNEISRIISLGERPLQIGALVAQCSFFIGALVLVLKDRLEGTMDRMFVSSFRPAEIFFGYLIGFTVVIMIQAPLMLAVLWKLFGVPVLGQGPRPAAAMALQLGLMNYIGVGLAFAASMVAQNESQVSMFLILLFVPSMLIGGLLFAVDKAPAVIRALGFLVPVKYMVLSPEPTMALAMYFVATVFIGSWVFRESQ